MSHHDSTPSETEESKSEASETKPKTRRLLGLEPIVTHHELKLKDKSLTYTAASGVIPLADEFGETEAEIFFTAYTLDGVDDFAERPLTFAFNGGPGSASIWLHMGALGPMKVVMQDEGWMPSPPYRLEPNEGTWLDFTDLVFIDPVGTGYSRASKGDLDAKFWTVKGDIESVGEFIRLYLTRYSRWGSPLYLAGESYGTTRAAGLAGHLVDKGIAFNGIVLASTALNLRPIFFEQGDDLPFQLFVPTYTATAWYHHQLDDDLQSLDLEDLLAEVETWCETEYASALAQGDRLDVSQAQAIGKTLARYTGLDLEYVNGSNLRIDIFRFCKELLRFEKRSVGRLDSRFKGVEALAVTEKPEFDPSNTAILPPFMSVFMTYAGESLGVETDMKYEPLSEDINEKWAWEKGELPYTGEALRSAIAKNPYMKTLVAQGYYDLATPLFATEYMLTHMNVDPELRSNITTKFYRAGHMFYLDRTSQAAFHADVADFVKSSS